MTSCGAALGALTPAAAPAGGAAGGETGTFGRGNGTGGADFVDSNGVIDAGGFGPRMPGSSGGGVPVGEMVAPAGGETGATGGRVDIGEADFVAADGVIDIRNLGRGTSAAAVGVDGGMGDGAAGFTFGFGPGSRGVGSSLMQGKI